MTVAGGLGLEGRIGYSIRVPDSWYELDCDPATRDASLARLVETRVRGNDEMWQQRHAITDVLRRQASAAHESGALYCAGFVMPTDDGPLTGAATVSLVQLPDPTEDGAGFDVLPRFREVPRSEDPTAPYAVTTVVTSPGVGDCARSHGIHDADLGNGHFVRHLFMLTAVPLTDVGRAFLVSLSSPVLALEAELLDLFDAVSGTFRVVRFDESGEVIPR